MTGDAFLTEPAGGAGRAKQAGAPTPLLDQEFDSGTLHALRAAVQAHAGQAGLSEDQAGEVVLAVHELAANAIAHGAGQGHLRMWDLAGALSCEVVDNGPADAAAASSRPGPSGAGGPSGADGPPGRSESADPWPSAHGHGLWLVRQVADHLDLRSGARGTRAIITFALPLPGESSK
jgi:anti-sigma regulatory factor (Ser/Thr protein kinase)